MKRIKTGLTGFILGDWLGMPYRGKGKGTFKPIWTKSYLRGDKCSGNTSMLYVLWTVVAIWNFISRI
ncbi:hypothetical protein [Phocaeicola dorei]|uniref:ADP-ribosylglycohydrolase n=1 Tax=Phocaeicola dorei DSM 17855 TaxID=483217 RepID=B6W0U9_9BACT|nr:hypothetical protein [Phocaeicola dorei]EEB24348.1 hypothetical protein BACDOR_03182 [Phocaeicola dorei DSM 17855]UWN84469.1 hypothetical protein NQ486_09965 [Phocaeicola dorei]